MKEKLSTLWRIARWPLGVLLLAYIGLVIYRIPAVGEQQRAKEFVAQIRAQKITLDEVMGRDLPPVPDSATNNATVAGIDANQNGIRDDVELAIFKEYPNSARIRAAELQYAMALQDEMTMVFNSDTLVAASQEAGRGFFCIGDATPRPVQSASDSRWNAYDAVVARHSKEIESFVLNTDARKKAQDNAFNYMVSHGDIGGPDCDIDLSTLPN